jgi:hypothetical protein
MFIVIRNEPRRPPPGGQCIVKRVLVPSNHMALLKEGGIASAWIHKLALLAEGELGSLEIYKHGNPAEGKFKSLMTHL